MDELAEGQSESESDRVCMLTYFIGLFVLVGSRSREDRLPGRLPKKKTSSNQEVSRRCTAGRLLNVDELADSQSERDARVCMLV